MGKGALCYKKKNIMRKIIKNYFSRRGGESLGSIVGGRVILVLHESIWNAPTDSLVLPAFNDTGFLGFPPLRVVYSIVPRSHPR